VDPGPISSDADLYLAGDLHHEKEDGELCGICIYRSASLEMVSDLHQQLHRLHQEKGFNTAAGIFAEVYPALDQVSGESCQVYFWFCGDFYSLVCL